jgi:hypothetical protein
MTVQVQFHQLNNLIVIQFRGESEEEERRAAENLMNKFEEVIKESGVKVDAQSQYTVKKQSHTIR